VKDLQTGATSRVSVTSGGVQSDGDSFTPAISSDGRYVAFVSAATNLVPGDTNAHEDVFLHDRQTATTTRVSLDSAGVQTNDFSSGPSVSTDGRYVTFGSYASNLVPGDSNLSFDVFLRDRQTSTTTRVSVDSAGVQATGNSIDASITPDGRYVVFTSYAPNLVAGDTNGKSDVFLRDLQTATTTRVSVGAGGVQGDNDSSVFARAAMSPDGRYVAFASRATNLVAGDTNAKWDVFLRDRQANTTIRSSVSSTAAQGDDNSVGGSISADGRYLAFTSASTNLVPGDTNASDDVFVRDLQLGSTVRASLSTGGVQGDAGSGACSIASNGNVVVFASDASTLVTGDTNARSDVFARDRGTTWLFTAFCFGDGTGGNCPCGNAGQPGHGCQNSQSTGGSILTATGSPSLAGDTMHFTASGELPSALSILLQGTTAINPVNYGDGLRCVGGALKRLYAHAASGGVVTMPFPADPTVSVKSAALGDTITPGVTRNYQVYYRDSNPTFCTNPPGGTLNVSRAIAVVWGL
jgi:Tol biopolymer transport system component